MADWLSSMQQTYEYYIVDPDTWKEVRRLENVTSCTISRESSAETLGSARIDTTEPIGENYVRVYLITIQNGVTEKHPLGTYLVQTPSTSFDGKVNNISMDAYTPLIEAKEKQPPIGYFVAKNENIMDIAYRLLRENVRAPVVKTTSSVKMYNDFISNTSDNWLTFIQDLIGNAKYVLTLDELGRILFAPKQDTKSMQPVWTYTDDNSSILYPEVTMNQDLYGIPNVVEVIYTEPNLKEHYYYRVVNDDSNSPTSTISRGREIIYRVTDPDFVGIPNNENQVKEYAETLLKELSTIEYTVTYSHGYCPVRLGDCIRLDYSRAGLSDIKARVISQSIKCVPGCTVTEKAVFSARLWR